MAIYRRLFTNVKTAQPDVVFLFGRALIGATGSITSQSGKGLTFARTGTGNYTITLDARNGIPEILYAQTVNVGAALPISSVRCWLTVQNLTTGVLNLVTTTTSAVGGSDPASGSFLYAVVVVRNATYST